MSNKPRFYLPARDNEITILELSSGLEEILKKLGWKAKDAPFQFTRGTYEGYQERAQVLTMYIQSRMHELEAERRKSTSDDETIGLLMNDITQYEKLYGKIEKKKKGKD